MDSMQETYKAMMGIKLINERFDRIEELDADATIDTSTRVMLINIQLCHIDMILIKHEN